MADETERVTIAPPDPLMDELIAMAIDMVLNRNGYLFVAASLWIDAGYCTVIASKKNYQRFFAILSRLPDELKEGICQHIYGKPFLMSKTSYSRMSEAHRILDWWKDDEKRTKQKHAPQLLLCWKE